MGPYQVLPLRSRVDLGAMAMKGYSAFPKSPSLLEPLHQIVLCHILDTLWKNLSPMQRSSQCILLLQPSGPYLGRVIFLFSICFLLNGISLPLPHMHTHVRKYYENHGKDRRKIIHTQRIDIFQDNIHGSQKFYFNVRSIFLTSGYHGKRLF